MTQSLRSDQTHPKQLLLDTRDRRPLLTAGFSFALLTLALLALRGGDAPLSLSLIMAWVVSFVISTALLMMADNRERLPWLGLAIAMMLSFGLAESPAGALLIGLFTAPLAAWLGDIGRKHSQPFLHQVALLWTLTLPAPLMLLLAFAAVGQNAQSVTQFAVLIFTLLIVQGLRLVIEQAVLQATRLKTATSWALECVPLWLDVVVSVGIVLAALLSSAWWSAALLVAGAAYAYAALEARRNTQHLRTNIEALQAHNNKFVQASDTEFEIATAIEQADAVDALLQRAQTLTHADAAILYRVDSGLRRVTLETAHGISDEQRAAWASLPHLPKAYRQDIFTAERSNADLKRFPEFAASEYATIHEMPLRAGNHIWGLLRLYFRHVHHLSEQDQALLDRLTGHAGVLIDNLEYYQVIESYANELAQLSHLSRVSTASLSMDEVLADMVRIMRQMISVKTVTLALTRSETTESPSLKLYGDAAAVDMLMFEHLPELEAMRREARPQAVQYRLNDAHLSPAMRELVALHGETLAIFPLLSQLDLLGMILLGDAAVSGLSDRQWQLIEMASNQIAAQVLNVRLYDITNQALDQRLQQLNILTTIAQQISAATDIDTILATMLEMAVKSTGANLGTVALLDTVDDTWKIIYYTESGVLKRAQRSRSADDGIFGQVSRLRDTLVIRDTRETPQAYGSDEVTVYLSAIGVPLMSENKVIGVLRMESLRPDFFSREQSAFLNNLAQHAVISIENAHMLEERQHQILTLRNLQALSIKLSHVTETPIVAQTVLQTALDMLNGRKAALFRIQLESGMSGLDTLGEFPATTADAPNAVLFKNSAVARRAAQTGEAQIAQETYRNERGEQQLLNALAVPIRRGERVREILCIGFEQPRNFSKRELDAIALLASQAAGHLENASLHEFIGANNDRMHAILNSMRDGIIVLNKTGNLVVTNPAAQRLLGIDLAEYEGQNFVDVLLGQTGRELEANATYTRDEVTALARQLRLEPERISRRQFSRATPKQAIYIEEIGSPVVDSHGQISGRLLVLRDVTEQKLLADYRDEVTHMAVHDLRGPLASIISSLNFTLDEPGISTDEPILRKTLTLSLDSANNLMRLVESMLDIARLEKRQMPLQLLPASIEHLIGEAVTSLDSSIQQASVQLRQNVPAVLPLLNVDHDVMRRVLINLIDNALRFTPSNTEILVEVEECPDMLIVRVADSGPGIPVAERERIFERFRQVKDNVPLRGSRGNGLGLTFCKLAVEAHGGQLWVEQDSPLPGACFAFTLPTLPKTA
jgi:PAS domain S-box-containing protein